LASSFAKKTHKKKHHKKYRAYPAQALPKPEEQKHFTSALPEDSQDGTHSFRQIRSLFFDKSLGYAEIKSLFTQMDINKDNKIDDTEWVQFYETIIKPFQVCDTDKNFQLNVAELKACLGTSDFSQIKHNVDSEEALTQLIHFMDRNEANLIGFLWLRRLNYAWATCSNGVTLNANRILCALTITSPRTRNLIPSEEKAFFAATVVLSEGYNWGQQSTVSVLQFAQVAYIYNYFSDYEIQMSESIRKDDALRAIQDGILPVWFNRLTCDQAFNENPNGMSFPAFAGIFYSVRLFASQTETLFLSKDNYTALIGSDLIPQRLKDYVAKTYTSTQDEIEASSKRVFQHVEEKHYFNQYNNIIFLQKKKKTHLKAVSALRKTTEVELDELLGNLEFPADSPSIIFNMYDNYRNGSIHLSDWIRFVKTSFTYMSLTPNGVQRFNYDQIAKKNDYLDGEYNCFAFGQTESKYQTLLYDWLTENVGYSVNMKEYLAWFRLPFGFEYLRQPGLPWRTSVKRTA